MSTKICCDGCGCDLSKGLGPEVTGERRVMSGGGGLPSGEFHLCMVCSVVAFHAAVTRPPVVDTHKLAGEIQDARAGRRG